MGRKPKYVNSGASYLMTNGQFKKMSEPWTAAELGVLLGVSAYTVAGYRRNIKVPNIIAKRMMELVPPDRESKMGKNPLTRADLEVRDERMRRIRAARQLLSQVADSLGASGVDAGDDAVELMVQIIGKIIGPDERVKKPSSRPLPIYMSRDTFREISSRIGMKRVAELLGVRDQTVYLWRSDERRRIPEWAADKMRRYANMGNIDDLFSDAGSDNKDNTED